MTVPPDQQERARRLAGAAVGRKALDVVALDVREITSFADTFILATGTSDRHVRSVSDAVREAAREAGERPLGVEGEDEGRWVLIDLGDTVVHVFQRDMREHYDLDRLFADAERIDLGDESEPADAAGQG